MICYLDTSAAMKLLVEDPASAGLLDYLQSTPELTVLASWLLHTELHCAANRHPTYVEISSVNLLLEAVTLVDLTRGDLVTAAGLPGQLRSHDALHLAVALRLGVEAILTYDAELAAAAEALGLRLIRPA